MLIEFSARVQLGKDDLHARDLGLWVDVRGNTPPVVLDRCAAVLVDAHVDLIGKAVRRLVDRVVDDLPENVVQSLRARRTDIHARAQTDGVQPFENGDVTRVVVILRHSYLIKMCRSTDIIPYLVIWGKRF